MTYQMIREIDLRDRELGLLKALRTLERAGELFLGSTWSNDARELAWRLDGVHDDMERLGMRPLAQGDGYELMAA